MARHVQGLRGPALIEEDLDMQADDRLARGHEGLPAFMDRDLKALLVQQGLGLPESIQGRDLVPHAFLGSRLSKHGPERTVGGARPLSQILEALERMTIDLPIVVRLDGTNAAEGRAMLAEAAPPNLYVEETMLSAAERVVELSRERG